MAADRVAGDGQGANEILAVESACVDQSAQAGCHRQTALAHRARLRRVEAGAWSGTFRRTELARLSSPCNPVDRRLWLPGTGAMPFSPLRQLGGAGSSRHPVPPTRCATRLHAPRRYQYGPNGIIHTPSPPCAARSQPTSPDLCLGALVVFAASYNTVVQTARGESPYTCAETFCGIHGNPS